MTKFWQRWRVRAFPIEENLRRIAIEQFHLDPAKIPDVNLDPDPEHDRYFLTKLGAQRYADSMNGMSVMFILPVNTFKVEKVER